MKRGADASWDTPAAARLRPSKHAVAQYVAPFILRTKAYLDRPPMDTAKKALDRMSIDEAQALLPLVKAAISAKHKDRVLSLSLGSNWVWYKPHALAPRRVGCIWRFNRKTARIDSHNVHYERVERAVNVEPYEAWDHADELCKWTGKQLNTRIPEWPRQTLIRVQIRGDQAFATTREVGSDRQREIHVLNLLTPIEGPKKESGGEFRI